jgi:hypothetical protein
MREARMPTTPSCQLSSNSAMPGVASLASSDSSRIQRLFLHAGLDFAAFAVQGIELLGDA